MEDCYLRFIKKQENPYPFYAPLHYHSCFELVYYAGGEGQTTIDGVKYHYGPHRFSIIAPNTKHDESTFSNTNLIFFGFTYNTKRQCMPTGLYNDFEDYTVLALVMEMLEEMEQKPPFYTYRLNNLLQTLLIAVFRQYYPESIDRHRHLAIYVQQYLDEHAGEPVDLQELAEMSGYSYDWMRHLFKLHTGQSLSQYIINRRLHKASEMLKSTGKSVSFIAAECHFPSASQFISHFKKQYALTPLQYRKLYACSENQIDMHDL